MVLDKSGGGFGYSGFFGRDGTYCSPANAYCDDSPFGGIGIAIVYGGRWHGDGGSASPSAPSGGSRSTPRIGGTFPNGETSGIPNGLPVRPLSIWQLLNMVPVENWCDFGPCVFGFSGKTQAANHGSWLQHGLNYLKNHPVFISVNEIVAAQITVQWSTKTVCANLGAGASVPPTKAVTVGVYNAGNMSNWTNVLSSWGYSFGSNLVVGYQVSSNSSGTIGGPTISGVGLSGSYTYGGCTTVP